MLVVMSNDGNWDDDIFGVVTVIPNAAALKDVAETMSAGTFVEMTQPMNEWLDENEASLCAYSGAVVAAVIARQDGLTDTVYVAIDLDAPG